MQKDTQEGPDGPYSEIRDVGFSGPIPADPNGATELSSIAARLIR